MREPSILAATRRSVKAASDLTDLDAAAVAVLLELARQIDVMAANGGLREDGKLDNVSIPTFLRYCEQLGLTPVAREKLAARGDVIGGKLAQLRAVNRSA